MTQASSVADGLHDDLVSGSPVRMTLRRGALTVIGAVATVIVLTLLAGSGWDVEPGLGWIAAATVGVAILLVLVAVVWRRVLLGHVDDISQAVQRLAGGETDARVPSVGPGELRQLVDGVNLLAEQAERLRDGDRSQQLLRGGARALDRRMREHLTPAGVADEAARGLGPLCGADRVHARFVVDGRVGSVAGQWTAPGARPAADAPPRPDHPLLSWRALTAQGHTARIVTDVLTDPDTTQLVGDPVVAGMRSFVVVPVLAGTELLAVLVAGRRTVDRPWTSSEVGLVESVADDMGRAVQHARLFEQQSTVVSQLREIDRTKSDFLSTISHELRTPLTSIAGYVEMMRDGEAGEVAPMQRQMLDVVARNTQRLRDLIEDVLVLSRVESGTFRTERLPVALRGVIEHAVIALRPQAAQADVRLDVIPAAGPSMLLGDAAQLEQVVLNLVGNALKFTPAGGRVTISLETTGADLLLRVEDTGIGIPDGEVADLFQRFFRASNAKAQQIAGTGLGLAIVASIVAAHHGRVEVDSAQGRGSTFTVVLPGADDETLRAARPGAGLRI